MGIKKSINNLKEVFTIDIPVALKDENIGLRDSYEMRKLYNSAREKAEKRISGKLPYGLQNYSQYFQLLHSAAKLESKINELMSKPSLTKRDINKIIGYKRALNNTYKNLEGFIQLDQFD